MRGVLLALALLPVPACGTPAHAGPVSGNVSGNEAAAEPLVVTRLAMGVRFQIALVGGRELDAVALEAVAREAFQEVSRLERVLNNWSEDSDVSRLNGTPGTEWVPVDPELAAVLSTAFEMHGRTEGAYDVTVWPLVRAWGLVDRQPRTPDEAELVAARARVGTRHVEVRRSPPAVRRRVEGVEIDVSSLAKGWAVDRVIEHLRRRGVPSAFVAAGGSTVAALGSGPEGAGWSFDVAPGVTWRLVDRAVSTSGRSDAGLPGGAVLEHILDPRTGRPAARRVGRAVFTGPSATEADMASTALVVLGPDGARESFARGDWGAERGALLVLDGGEQVALGVAAELAAP